MKSKQDTLIKTVKDLLKTSPVVRAMFEEFQISIDEVDNVEIVFAPLDVSAKTKDKKIYLNDKFLKEGEFVEELHYIVHELTHYLQQVFGEVRHYPDIDAKDYLAKPTEIEAFQYQVQFMRDQYGEGRAKEYVTDLIDFHELVGDEATDIRTKLLGE
jgi:hypothetical protein